MIRMEDNKKDKHLFFKYVCILLFVINILTIANAYFISDQSTGVDILLFSFYGLFNGYYSFKLIFDTEYFFK